MMKKHIAHQQSGSQSDQELIRLRKENEQLKASQLNLLDLKENLKETTGLLEAMFNAIPDIIGIQDKDHTMIRYNQAGYEFLGKSIEEVKGKKCYELINRKERCDLCATTLTLKSHQPARVEKYVPEMDIWFDVRSYPIFDDDGNLVSIIEHLRDITDMKRAEKALRDKDERLNLVLEGIRLGTWSWNIRSNEITSDHRLSQLLGYDQSDIPLIIESWEKYCHPDDFNTFLDRVQTHFKGLIPYYEVEYRIRHRMGDYIWVSVRGKVIERDEAGNPLQAVGTILDITNRKQAEFENLRLQNQLAQTQKLEAIGTLAGGIAHDFNNILTVINGNTELAIMKSLDNEVLLKYLNTIHESGKKAERLIRQLLVFSRKQIVERVYLQINTIISDLDKMMSRLIGEDIEIKTDLAKKLPLIFADPVQIEQILINLLVNARDAIKELKNSNSIKRIEIKTKLVSRKKTSFYRKFEFASGDYLCIQIRDSGIGMDKVIQSKIFEPFFTTKEVNKGTGLGLSTVYGIVKQNDGFIDIKSVPGKGTTFYIYWPASRRTRDSRQDKSEQTILPSGEEVILLVEDEDNVRKFTATVLKNHGYHVIEAINGPQALAMMKNNNKMIDLLITDLIMPQMSGDELAKKMKEKYPELKIIFISGFTGDQLIDGQKIKRTLNFIQKPYSVKALISEVRRILDES